MKTTTLPAWATPDLPVIENPNTSGQGYCAGHRQNPLHEVCARYGYSYSHSVPVTFPDGKRVCHCYKARPGERNEHNVSFYHGDTRHEWQTSVSCGSGHRHTGYGAAMLAKHLAGKARRYGLAQSSTVAICYSTHPKQPHKRALYVSALPGQHGADWGYTHDPAGVRTWIANGGPDGRGEWRQLDKAIPLSPYWQRRFRCDCARTGVTFHALPVREAGASV